MPRTDFPDVRTRREHVAPCPVCSRMTTRAKVFVHTINPFHPAVNPYMTADEKLVAVRAAVHAEADAWEPDHRHLKCRGEA